MRARATCTRLRSPSDSVPNVRSAKPVMPTWSSSHAARPWCRRLVLLAPAAGDGVGGGHDVGDGLVRRDALGERGARQPDPRPQLEDVGAAEALVEDLDGPAGGVQQGRGEGQDRGLPGAVGPEDHPALALAHVPRHVVDDGDAAADHVDVDEPQDVAHLPNTSHRNGAPRVAGCSCPVAQER